MAPVVPNPDKIRAFPDQEAFQAWLARNHDSETELWLRIYKKGSATPTITNAEAIDSVLCWGWIDGIRKGYDETSFLQRFSPRKPKSVWSQINRDHVARLLQAGRMTAHGLKHVEAAKADGRWEAAYASASTMEMPQDLLGAIENETKALQTFGTLNKANRYALAFRVGKMRTAAGRENKIKAFVEMLARGQTIHPNGKGDKS